MRGLGVKLPMAIQHAAGEFAEFAVTSIYAAKSG